MSLFSIFDQKAFDYYQQCSRALNDATSRDELFETWRSFDSDKLTQEYKESLIIERDAHEEKFYKSRQRCPSNWELANFCHGGDLDED